MIRIVQFYRICYDIFRTYKIIAKNYWAGKDAYFCNIMIIFCLRIVKVVLIRITVYILITYINTFQIEDSSDFSFILIKARGDVRFSH